MQHRQRFYKLDTKMIFKEDHFQIFISFEETFIVEELKIGPDTDGEPGQDPQAGVDGKLGVVDFCLFGAQLGAEFQNLLSLGRGRRNESKL